MNDVWRYLPAKVISGGQTGANRGALEAAVYFEVPQGGYCPRGRKAEDGKIPKRYLFVETKSSQYPDRTRLNVSESSATVIFTHGHTSAGTRLTLRCLKDEKKPYLHLDLDRIREEEAIDLVDAFIRQYQVEVLNIAGNRESRSPGIQGEVKSIVLQVLSRRIERGHDGSTPIGNYPRGGGPNPATAGAVWGGKPYGDDPEGFGS